MTALTGSPPICQPPPVSPIKKRMQNFGTKAWTSQQRACVLLTANLTCTCDYANPLLKQPQGQSCPRDVVHIALPRSDPPCSTNLVTICLFKLLPLFLSYTSQSSQRTASVFPICAPTNSQPLCLALQCLPIPAAHSPNAQTFLLLHPQYYLQARSSEIPPARGVATPLLTPLALLSLSLMPYSLLYICPVSY